MSRRLLAWADHPAFRVAGIVFLLKDVVAAMVGLGAAILGLLGNAGLIDLIAVGLGVIALVSVLVPLAAGQRKLDKRLLSRRKPGERLLREARQPQTVATTAQIDDFMGRVTDWVDSVTAILIAYDDRQHLDAWTRVAWHRGRPQPRTGEARQFLEQPISEQLRLLEGFCRELKGGS